MDDRSPGHPDPDELITVATVLKPHGLDGHLKVILETDNRERFTVGSRLLVADPAGEWEAVVQKFSAQGRYAVIKLAGIDGLEAAERLRGRSLAVRGASLKALPNGAYYAFQIIGLRVVSESNQPLGVITAIERMPAGDVYLVAGEAGQFYIPAMGDIIRTIDLERGLVVIEDRPGLR